MLTSPCYHNLGEWNFIGHNSDSSCNSSFLLLKGVLVLENIAYVQYKMGLIWLESVEPELFYESLDSRYIIIIDVNGLIFMYRFRRNELK